MSFEKKILSFDKNELFVSSRICEFVIDNALKTNLSDEFSKTIDSYIEKNGFYMQAPRKYLLTVLSELIVICRKANFSNDQFYQIGNRSHELHVLVSALTNQNIENPITWSNELNFIRMEVVTHDYSFSSAIELHRSILLDFKPIVEPLLQILSGFIDRISVILINSKVDIQVKKNTLHLLHTRSEVSNFDMVKFITNEQFIYSRIKGLLEKEQTESIAEKISFFLFKDIGFSAEEIASKLNLSLRSLQRKLKEEGSNFRSLKELVRKELSIKYLQDESLSIHDICLLLSYSERGAFEKAFKKWYGKNPSEYKKQLLG